MVRKQKITSKKNLLPKLKKVSGRVMLLKVISYKGSMVYIRRIGIDFFEYLVVFNKEIYTAYWVIKPEKGKKDLTKDQINQAGALAMAGAVATIDIQLGKKLDKKTERIVNTFEKGRIEC